jgi:Ca-activated chloride channel family protein
MNARSKIFILSLLVVLVPFASAQQIEEQVEVQLVQVDLVATDKKGALVTDLTNDDFILKENGNVQKVTHFYNSSKEEIRFPLTMSFLVDTSYSMGETVAGMTRIDIARQAAELIMAQLRPDDKLELIEFNQKPVELVSFTPDAAAVRSKLEALTFQEKNTAMHDSVLFALDKINKETGRKIIVIFSDGMDSASKAIEDDVIDAVKKSEATLITFYAEFAKLNFPAAGGGFGGDPSSMGRVRIRMGEDQLRLYSQMSGGLFFSFRKEPELLKALESFRAFVRSQYTLAYTPSDIKKKKGWRKIKVECKRKDIELRHREGYWAS